MMVVQSDTPSCAKCGGIMIRLAEDEAWKPGWKCLNCGVIQYETEQPRDGALRERE